jgi:hypothetical protein
MGRSIGKISILFGKPNPGPKDGEQRDCCSSIVVSASLDEPWQEFIKLYV